MKSILALIVVFLAQTANAQYFYKDIIGTRETAEMMRAYINNRVSRVILTSFDADDTKSDNFYVEQEFIQAAQTLKTSTRTGDGDPSVLVSWIDAKGHVIKTLDSSIAFKSTSTYNYNDNGDLVRILSVSTDSAKRSTQTEEHLWQYRDGAIAGMLRIKNSVDTIFVGFKTDEKRNVVEEQETRKGVKSEPYYYYYNVNGQLTDIVRFNPKAKRLLPEYMFEYSTANHVIQKITVPSGSDKYLIWRYQYNGQGLKTKEAIYNKQKQLTGKVDYQYSFNN
jgi:hypothetical protein